MEREGSVAAQKTRTPVAKQRAVGQVGSAGGVQARQRQREKAVTHSLHRREEKRRGRQRRSKSAEIWQGERRATLVCSYKVSSCATAVRTNCDSALFSDLTHALVFPPSNFTSIS